MRRCSIVAASVLVATLHVGAVTASDKNKSSLDVVVRGCLKGRDLTAIEVSDPEQSADIVGRAFHLSAKREVIDVVKQQNGHYVEVTGTVKKAALAEPGIKVGRARIVIGSSPMSNDPTRNPARDPASMLIAMDATAVLFIAETCRVPKN